MNHFKQISLTDGTRIGTTTPGWSGLGNNGNEWVPHTLQISRTGATPSNIVHFDNQDTFLLGKVLILYAVLDVDLKTPFYISRCSC